MSASDRPPDAWMRICCSLPVPLSLAWHVDDAVGVDVEGDLDLRHAARRRRNADEIELGRASCCRPPFRARPGTRGWSPRSGCPRRWRTPALFLVGIVVLRSISRVNTPPSVSMPSDSGVTSSSSTSLTSPCSTPAWIAAPIGNDLVGVDALVRLLAEQLLHDLLDLRHAGHAADQDHFVDLGRREAGVLDRLPARLDRLLHQIVDQRLELGAGELHGQVLRTGGIRGDERQVDLGLRGGRQLDLRLLGGFLQPLQRELVACAGRCLGSFWNSSAR